MGKASDLYLDTRLAGQVTRYHTWMRHRNQSIAEHSWQLCRIYFSIVNEPDPRFLHHLIFHDIGENTTGDLPYPVKRDNPPLKEMLDVIEDRSRIEQLDHWASFQYISMNDIDHKLFKQIELIEMAEWGMDEMCLGNCYGQLVADRCLQALYHQNPCIRLIDYVIKRVSLFNRQYLGEPVWVDTEWWNIHNWKELYNERSANQPEAAS